MKKISRKKPLIRFNQQVNPNTKKNILPDGKPYNYPKRMLEKVVPLNLPSHTHNLQAQTNQKMNQCNY